MCRNSHTCRKRADLSPLRYSHHKSPALLTAAVSCNSAQPPPAKPRPMVPHQAGFLVSEPVQLGPVRDRASGYSGVVKEPFIASALWRGAALAEPNSPLLLELCFNTLDPRMPPMLGRRRNRDKMQEMHLLKHRTKPSLLLPTRSDVLQARVERRFRKLHQSDSTGNSVSIPGQRPGQEA